LSYHERVEFGLGGVAGRCGGGEVGGESGASSSQNRWSCGAGGVVGARESIGSVSRSKSWMRLDRAWLSGVGVGGGVGGRLFVCLRLALMMEQNVWRTWCTLELCSVWSA